MKLVEALKTCSAVQYAVDARPVVSTVADALCPTLMPQASLFRGDPPPEKDSLRLGLDGDFAAVGPALKPEGEWAFFRFAAGSGELSASAPHLLYALFCRLRDEWLEEPAASFVSGRLLKPSFRWLAGRDEFLTGRLGFSQRRRRSVDFDDIEAGMRELARLGCNHVVINELARRAWETGPAGEVYYRFYDYTPDIDQYVETRLNAGTYPSEYLQANLSLLKRLARLAQRYGLVPGFYAAHPRSVPESLLARYPFLRGARIDHTFRSYLPRYTLSVSHPAVRWHYAELIRTLLRQVPELGFIKMLLNDSGSGFEYTASLYPGRNGGPYIVREWRPDAEIAQKAADNVIRYYRSLRDAARQIRPDFHLMTGLKNIAEEQGPILAGMDGGINLQTQSQRADVNDPEWQATRTDLESRGAHVLSDTNATGSSYVLGVPSPWTVARRLQGELDKGFDRIDLYLNPVYMAPWDINREVVVAFQVGEQENLDARLSRLAQRWAGDAAPTLMEIWRQCDTAVRHAPIHFLYGWLGFTWYRWWVRPFVPDISAIPQAERTYYEEPMLTVFNNPHNIDFAADALWSLDSIEACDTALADFATKVWPALDKALALAVEPARAGNEFWVDLHDRLYAYRCYAKTMSHICAWIAGVHGYIAAEDTAAKEARRHQVDQAVKGELANARRLLVLWRRSDTDFMPLQDQGESVHNYGLNLGELIERKITLMEKYGDREPRIDTDHIFRAPPDFPLETDEYIDC
jgi:hypothetical protein